MDFTAITGLQKHNFPLWQAAESYLHLGQKAYRVTEIKDDTLYLKKIHVKKSFLVTALKIASYLTLVLPLLALIIKAAYRKKYTLEVLGVKKDEVEAGQKSAALHKKSIKGLKMPAKQQQSLLKSIQDFKEKFEEKLNTDEGSAIFTLFKENPKNENVDIAETSRQLDQYLSDIKSYSKDSEKVIKLVYLALQNILEKQPSQEKLDLAKLVYKRTSEFLRKNTDKSYLKEYNHYLNSELFEAYDISPKPSSYLLDKVQKINGDFQTNHVGLVFLLKQLRKQIKLATKLEKIKIKVQDNEEIKNIPEELQKKAFDYLGITWLHGAKAFVIASACETSNGEILPAGELKKRKLQVITGEMEIGASAIGVNKESISGVNLSHVERGIRYAQGFKFELDKEVSNCQDLLNMSFTELDNFLNYHGSFSRKIESLKRVRDLHPEKYEQDKPLLQNQLLKIYEGLKTHIFDKKPNEIFKWHDNYYTSGFYSFLKAVEEFEDILNSPIEKPNHNIDNDQAQELANIPTVFASTTKYGLPQKLSPMEEPSEEIYPGNLALGKDLQIIFTNDENIENVRDLINKYGLQEKTQVESLKVLEIASKMDRVLGTYFYDFYSLKKWQALV